MTSRILSAFNVLYVRQSEAHGIESTGKVREWRGNSSEAGSCFPRSGFGPAVGPSGLHGLREIQRELRQKCQLRSEQNALTPKGDSRLGRKAEALPHETPSKK